MKRLPNSSFQTITQFSGTCFILPVALNPATRDRIAGYHLIEIGTGVPPGARIS